MAPDTEASQVHDPYSFAWAAVRKSGWFPIVIGLLCAGLVWFVMAARSDNKDLQKQYIQDVMLLNKTFVDALKDQSAVNQASAAVLDKIANKIEYNTQRIDKQGERLEYNEKQVTKGVETVEDNKRQLENILEELRKRPQ